MVSFELFWQLLSDLIHAGAPRCEEGILRLARRRQAGARVSGENDRIAHPVLRGRFDEAPFSVNRLEAQGIEPYHLSALEAERRQSSQKMARSTAVCGYSRGQTRREGEGQGKSVVEQLGKATGYHACSSRRGNFAFSTGRGCVKS